jgi:hypothetical protein
MVRDNSHKVVLFLHLPSLIPLVASSVTPDTPQKRAFSFHCLKNATAEYKKHLEVLQKLCICMLQSSFCTYMYETLATY